VTRARSAAQLGLVALTLALLLAPGTLRAADAPLAAEIDRFVAATGALGAGTPPAQLEANAERLGALVARARVASAPAAQQQKLGSAADRLVEATDAVRSALEARAGDDEAALEALYRSTDWQRLDYTEALLGYWLAWTCVGRAQALPAGAERRALLQKAERGFARSGAELRLPGLARSSLLGLGATRRELGDRAGAREALERLERALRDGSDPATLASVRFELALLAFQEGDLTRGRALAQALAAEGGLPPAQALALARVEAEALLAAQEAGKAGPEASAEAAALLRKLSASGDPEAARAAMAILLAHADALAGQDVGGAGALVEAETAFEAKRWPEARDAYARALAEGSALPDAARRIARYKHAVALAQTGARAEASAALDGLLAGGANALEPSLREPAARLAFTLARAEAAETRDPTRERRLAVAAERLLAVAPRAPEAADARLVVALGQGAGARGRRATLEAVAPGSAGYAVARYELVRDRAAEMARLDEAGKGESDAARRNARALAADLDTLTRLVAEGRADAALVGDPTLAALRAQAAATAGEAPDAVLARIAAAERRAGLDAASAGTLARLRATTLAKAGRFDELARALAALDAGALAADATAWSAWLEALAARSPPPPPALVATFARRVASAAKGEPAERATLVAAEALVRAGRGAEALPLARGLVERDPAWGDARVALARALGASGDAPGAARVWGEVAAGSERGSAPWLEATLARASAQRDAGDGAGACATLARASTGDGLRPEPASGPGAAPDAPPHANDEKALDAATRDALARAAAGCVQAGATAR